MTRCRHHMIASGGRTIEPTRAAFDRHNRRIDERMKQMIWTHPRSRSYYQNSKGRPVGPWPFRLVDMWNEMRGPVHADYRVE